MEKTTFELSFLGQLFTCEYIKNSSRAIEVLRELTGRDELFAIDVETKAKALYVNDSRAALSPHLGCIRLLQVFEGRTCYVFDLDFFPHAVVVDFLRHGRFLAHYALFELQMFRALGVAEMDIGCTHIAGELINQAKYPFSREASLEALVKSVLGVSISKAMQRSNWGESELTFEQIEYAALDAISTYFLGIELSAKLAQYKLERIYSLCKAAQNPITSLHYNGLGLDAVLHRALINKWGVDLWEAKKEVLQFTGLHGVTSHKIGDWLVANLDADVLRVWPRTASKNLSTDSHTFADFAHVPLVKPFAKYQKLNTLANTFGESLLKSVNPATGRLHSHYRLLGARTGRLSSSKPNLQNAPRDTYFRNVFVPAKECTFVCADYSQIELRVAAELSGDKEMTRCFKEGVDIHTLTASRITRKKVAEVTKKERQCSKAYNFGLAFGLGPAKFVHYARMGYGVEISETDARANIEEWRKLYSGYRTWQVNQAATAEKTCRVRTPSGKLRRLDPKNTYGTSMNTPVQGGAAEIMLEALVRLEKKFTSLDFKAKLVNVVHDEILVECPMDEVEKVKDAINTSMADGYTSVFPDGVTHGLVDMHTGKTWGEAKG